MWTRTASTCSSSTRATASARSRSPRCWATCGRKISQVEELIRAAKTTIFFVDENQIISPDEVGEPRLIRATAERMGVEYQEFALTSQFRCNGSDAYLAWLDDIFELSGEHRGLKLATPAGFDFKILDTPDDLLDEVQAKNAQEPNTARLLAGWCWPWSDPLAGQAGGGHPDRGLSFPLGGQEQQKAAAGHSRGQALGDRPGRRQPGRHRLQRAGI